jgi:hypothetical protein
VLTVNEQYMLAAASFLAGYTEPGVAQQLDTALANTARQLSRSATGHREGNPDEPVYTFDGYPRYWINEAGEPESDTLLPPAQLPSGDLDAPWAAQMHQNWATAVENRRNEVRRISTELHAYRDILIVAMRDYTDVDLNNAQLIAPEYQGPPGDDQQVI